MFIQLTFGSDFEKFPFGNEYVTFPKYANGGGGEVAFYMIAKMPVTSLRQIRSGWTFSKHQETSFKQHQKQIFSSHI